MSSIAAVAVRMRENYRIKADVNRILDIVEKALFLCACAVLLTYAVFNSSFFARWMTEEAHIETVHIAHTVYLLLGIVEFRRMWRGEYGKREAVMLALIIFMVCLDIYLSYEYVPCAAALLFSSRKYEIRWLCAIAAGVVCICMVVIIVCSIVGIIPDLVVQQGDYFLGEGGRVRHCLGFLYCLYPAQYFLTATLTVCWLRSERLRIWEALFLVAINALLLYFTDCRASFLLSIVGVGGTLAYRLSVIKHLPLRGFAGALVWAFVATVLITVVAVAMWHLNSQNQLIDKLNIRLGGRVQFAYSGIVNYGITPFGKPVTFWGSGFDMFGNRNTAHGDYNYVDNAFVNIAIRHGWVYALSMVGLFTSVSVRAFKEKDYMLVFVLAIIAMHCLIDDFSMRLACDTLMFTFACLGQPKGECRRCSPCQMKPADGVVPKSLPMS